MELLTLHGPNSLDPPKPPSLLLKLIKDLFSGMSLIMILGSVLCIATYIITEFREGGSEKENLYLGISLIVIVFISTLLAFIYENKNSKLLQSFSKLMPKESLVLRNSRSVYVNSETVVVGDIVLLHAGDMVPADLRILKSDSVKIDNSSLTGESKPQIKKPGVSESRYIDAENMVFAYTFVVEGSCIGVSVSTGNNTVMGKIAQLTASLAVEGSTLSKEIHDFIKILTYIAFVIGTTCFILSITVTNSGLLSSFIFFIGIIVANVPEGLLLTVTLCLALTAKRMAKRNCIIKNLHSIESLGSTNVICSDKTGTLTQNKMLASHLWYNKETKRMSYTDQSVNENQAKLSFEEVCFYNICLLCNNAEVKKNQEASVQINDLIIFGNATDVALLRLSLLKYGPDTLIREDFDKIFEIPFNFCTKFQCKVYQKKETKEFHILMKGAPERIINLCDKYLQNGQVEDITEEYLDNFKNVYESLGNKGERVIGLACLIVSQNEYQNLHLENLTVLSGLI
ncbi:Sodium/potassium-transporting ATPase subunit alpha-4 [Thelohanellus kitauei]|uniref:Sodium/potassium-transporting ATPase subunit alpha-4 n=1 Tax=Thelohanellus kitauei TaxID=669202 RepID=A0A0C2JL74_THEKT|nr:Sodium/potassium-transporting ATPase subunit alpha-4 [Thelohanellus kitauei]